MAPTKKAEDMVYQVGNPNMSPTKEQYAQPVNLLQHFHVGDVGECCNNAGTSSGASHFTGTLACSASVLSVDFSLLSCNCFESRADIWILDYGASNHMTFNKSLLSHVRTLLYPLLITLPSGYRVRVTEIGNVTCTTDYFTQSALCAFL